MAFFDRLKTSVTGLTEQQKYASSIRKVTSQIEDCKNQIANLTQQIGARFVENHLNETDTEFEDLLSGIRQCNEQIASFEAEIERLKAQQAAEEAARQQALQEKEAAERAAREQAREEREAQKAAAQQAQQAVVPPVNAAPQQAAVPPTDTAPQQGSFGAPGIKYCTVCGQPNDKDALFCIYCGNRFEAMPTPVAEGIPAPAAVQAAEGIPAAAAEAVPTAEEIPVNVMASAEGEILASESVAAVGENVTAEVRASSPVEAVPAVEETSSEENIPTAPIAEPISEPVEEPVTESEAGGGSPS